LVDPAPFQQLTLAASAKDKLAGLVDREGDFIGRSIDYPNRLGRPGSAALRGAVTSGKPAGIYSGLTLEGVPNYTAFARSPLSGWSAHIAFPPTLLDVPRRRMIAAAGIAAASALALALFLIWFTLRQLAQARRVEQRLQDTQKLEALGQLTGGIAHDFNNLLTPILGGLDLLSRNDGLDDRSRRMANGALASARKAAKLTSQLLAFSRRQRLEIRPVDLRALLTEIEPLLRQSVGPETSIAIDVTDDARCVLSDSNQLELALLNLVLNARDALPDGGSIRIASRPAGGGDRETSRVALTVTDDGVGMSPEVLSRAAEPFYTTKPAGSGTGLGLAQVHGIVEQSGGTLSIDSAPGKGTAVTIILPGGELPPEAAPAPSHVASERPSANLNVLVCDDDADVRSLVARTLEEAGYAVEAVGDGRTAVEAVKNSTPDLLVVDFAMPFMNGAEVARRVRRLAQPPAILVITGYADTEALAAIGDDIMILRKPFEPDALIEAVTRVLNG
jgi:signal transduction histidine kinase/CheY-like chemotaxis protein